MKKFALIGAAGYVAPRHMKAIADVGGDLVAALDPHDSVGVLDRYFPGCRYFREFERFDRFCTDAGIDYVSVCSPNYLHESHCRFALRIGADAICEKPVCLNVRNLDRLQELENGNRVWAILQLRIHEFAKEVKHLIDSQADTEWRFNLVYFTPRGAWYDYSWKGDVQKSGGLATNIGIHLFDLLCWLFGGDAKPISMVSAGGQFPWMSSGELVVGNTKGNYQLSRNQRLKPQRRLSVWPAAAERQGELVFEFSEGFEALHSKMYHEILNGRGFGIDDIRPATAICEEIRGKTK